MPTVKSSARSGQSTSPDSAITESPIIKGANRTKRAEEYEERINGLFNIALRMCVEKPATVPDAAAIIAHGPVLSAKVGDLADQDERVRRMVDLVTAGSENPYVALVAAALPLIAQIVRNHETTDLNASRRVEYKIPFTKRTIGFKLRFRLNNPFARSITHDPKQLVQQTLGNPEIAAALAEQGINVAWSPNGKM